MTRKQFRLDDLDTVAEEITLMLGLKTKVNEEKETIEVDTLVGIINFKGGFKTPMENVYRFIYIYGMRLTKYGIAERIKAETN